MGKRPMSEISYIVDTHATEKREKIGAAISALRFLSDEDKRIVKACLASGDDLPLERHIGSYRERLCKNLIR